MKQALVFGEVLFDVFPNNKKVLGGAPFNVAWNLHQFGAQPLFTSCIGNDDNGDQILALMREQHLDTKGIQIDKNHPTGTVTIEMSANTHQFNINADQAYDYIEYTQIKDAMGEKSFDLLYFGTLAIRAQQSNDTLKQLLTHNIPAFVDINLRNPWWTIETVQFALTHSRWAKLNDEELLIISKALFGQSFTLEDAINRFVQEFGFEKLIITCGDKGAYLCTPDKTVFKPSPAVAEIQDTVGAGDAFSSVVIFGILNDWTPDLLLQRALDFAAKVCGLQGAVTTNTPFYQSTLEQWQQQQQTA